MYFLTYFDHSKPRTISAMAKAVATFICTPRQITTCILKTKIIYSVKNSLAYTPLRRVL
jgi:hypothetical protein